MSRIMLDLETLSTENNAVILSIGAVRFNDTEITDTFYRVLDIDSQPKRHISGSTLRWWMQQSKEAQEVVSTPSFHIAYALSEFANFVDHDDEVWANSPDFDCTILGNAYSEHTRRIPWHFYNTRCLRTLRALRPDVVRPVNALAHNALEDAKAQAIHAIELLKALK